MDKEEWLSQARRGLLEYSILLLISKKDMYGYELISSLNNWAVLSTSEGTIYPLLRRLEKNDLIESSWKESVPGVPPRKYYNLTSSGIISMNMMKTEWGNLINAIGQIEGNEGN